MKKLIVPFLALFLLSACTGKTAANGSEADETKAANSDMQHSDMSEEGAKEFVATAYHTYFNPSKEDEDRIDNAEITLFGLAYMDKFFSDDLLQAIVDANDKQLETNTSFFDYNIWTNSQDNTGFALKEVKCTEFLEGTDNAATQATIEVRFTVCDEERKALVVVQYSNDTNSWLITDFINPYTNRKLQDSICDYLK